MAQGKWGGRCEANTHTRRAGSRAHHLRSFSDGCCLFAAIICAGVTTLAAADTDAGSAVRELFLRDSKGNNSTHNQQ